MTYLIILTGRSSIKRNVTFIQPIVYWLYCRYLVQALQAKIRYAQLCIVRWSNLRLRCEGNSSISVCYNYTTLIAKTFSQKMVSWVFLYTPYTY